MNGSGAASRERRRRLFTVAGLIIVITVLHYTIDVRAGAVHDVLLRSYYLPIVLAGLWFGVRGGLLAALAVSIVFFPHALHGWDAPYTSIFRLIEIMMYYVIGGLTGLLSSRTRLALDAERKAAAEREKTHEDLKRKTRQLFQTEEELRRSERLAALGRMSGGLAHEIRNPLASIKTSVEMLQERCDEIGDDSSSGITGELLSVIAEETDRLNRILTEFLQFARAETRGGDDGGSECRLGEVVSGILEFLRRDFEGAGIAVRQGAVESDLTVAVAGDHLRQVLLNLLLNASEAMPGGGTVEIGIVDRSDQAVTLAVEDSGGGIAPEVARTLFDPFVSTKVGGTGLGLSIVLRLIEASGGTIRLDRTDGTGARFLLTLPLARASTRAAEPAGDAVDASGRPPE